MLVNRVTNSSLFAKFTNQRKISFRILYAAWRGLARGSSTGGKWILNQIHQKMRLSLEISEQSSLLLSGCNLGVLGDNSFATSFYMHKLA